MKKNYVGPSFLNLINYMFKLKSIIENFANTTEENLVNELKANNTLTPFEKNFVYTYLFPKPLKHMELLDVLGNKRGGKTSGFLAPDDTEILILLRAYRTAQYKKFILHLLHSYIENEKGTYVVNEKVENDTCAICGKKIYNFEDWNKILESNPGHPESNNREYLMFGNDQTGLCMCLDCLVQLKTLNEYLEAVEGSDYLTKRVWRN